MRVKISDNYTTDEYQAENVKDAAIDYASTYDSGDHTGWVAAIATNADDPDDQLCFRFSSADEDVYFGQDAEWLDAWQRQ